MPASPLPRALRMGLFVAAVALAVNLLAAALIGLEIGDADVLDALRTVLMWAMLPPIAIALVRIGALRHRVGVWHVIGLLLCWLGDGLGATTGITIVLLAAFLLGHIAYLAALWPTRRRSLAWGPTAIGYAFVALLAGGITAANAGALAVPVLLYSLLLAAMAAFAAIDTAGFLGGLLFLVSDLVLGLGLFVMDIPDPLRTFCVLIPYVGAQALLAISLQQRLALGEAMPTAPATGIPARTTSGYYRTE
ncbi:lysoplasmalogenase family protein [Agrococcus sp. ARC_14]|uniref:lysoplasmalogenase family protein n=1 Tax=Agrococcus sp. ARC_14 TaxID=2919927 RepID=UPI001F070F9B|nr:lysoplasmalogenase family protein [Agrococcus sp. ARC_14]MCH1883297.1 lysoplasmalogenase [Agrococcus sp. ARC_14]